MVIHQRTHPNLDVPGCFGCRVSSVAIAPSALGNTNVRVTNETEKAWDVDIPAYKRLRANGVQPRQIDGSARIEASANTLAQVEA